MHNFSWKYQSRLENKIVIPHFHNLEAVQQHQGKYR